MDFTHIYQFTDCISLEAHLHQAGAGTAGDKRLAIDVSELFASSLVASMWRGEWRSP